MSRGVGGVGGVEGGGIAARAQGGNGDGEGEGEGNVKWIPARLGACGRRGDRAASHQCLLTPLGGGSPPTRWLVK